MHTRALRQVYVLVSRVTDPQVRDFVFSLRLEPGRYREERKLLFQNFLLTGLPPKDLWEDISQLWLRAGINVDDAWKRACSVTNEWVYEPGPGPLRSRIRQRINRERCPIPLKNRSF